MVSISLILNLMHDQDAVSGFVVFFSFLKEHIKVTTCVIANTTGSAASHCSRNESTSVRTVVKTLN